MSNCPKCGSETNNNQKFCTSCGASLIISSNKELLIVTAVSILVTVCLAVFLFFYAKHEQNSNTSRQAVSIQDNRIEKEYRQTPKDTLAEINNLQVKYWEIIKRNNTLVNLEPDIGAANDREELNALFAELKSKINGNEYFTEYLKIEKDFSQSIETIDITNKYYEAADKLLNKTYKAVKEKLSETDFEQLKLSQRKWLKDVQAYQNQKFYEIYEYENKEDADIVKIYSEINMKEFRTLLLMLYL